MLTGIGAARANGHRSALVSFSVFVQDALVLMGARVSVFDGDRAVYDSGAKQEVRCLLANEFGGKEAGRLALEMREQVEDTEAFPMPVLATASTWGYGAVEV